MENTSGYYNSQTKQIVADRVNVVYSDFGLDWSESSDRTKVLEYCLTLKEFLLANLWEEEILISVYPVSHIRE